MSFSTVCPGCNAQLTAPDSAEGKRIKCKKCGDPFVARPLDDEGDELPERPSVKASTRSRPRPVEDDEDDRPPPTGQGHAGATTTMTTARDGARVTKTTTMSRDQRRRRGRKRRRPARRSCSSSCSASALYSSSLVGPLARSTISRKTRRMRFRRRKGAQGPSLRAGRVRPVEMHLRPAGWNNTTPRVGTGSNSPPHPRPNPQQVQTPTGQTTVTVYLSGGQNEVFVSGPFPVPADRMGLTDEEILDKVSSTPRCKAAAGTFKARETSPTRDLPAANLC